MLSALAILLVACLMQVDLAHSFTQPAPLHTSQTSPSQQYPKNNGHLKVPVATLSQRTIVQRQNSHHHIIFASSSDDDDFEKEDKFSFFQRIESIKTATVGLLAGGILSTPFTALHDIPLYGAAQWEFDTDMGSLQSALFAIVYRYCVREEDDNDMLNMGVVGAFIAVRTLSRVRVPIYCSAVPLDCGDPLGYFDYDMIQQLVYNGLESVALFGGAALAMEFAYGKKWISKFPN